MLDFEGVLLWFMDLNRAALFGITVFSSDAFENVITAMMLFST